jgi:hypothetical protein
MRRSTLWMCALVMIATFGCKQIDEQVQKIKAKIAAARQRIRPGQPAAPAAPAQPAPAQPQPAAPTPGARAGRPRRAGGTPAGPTANLPGQRPGGIEAPELPRPNRDLPYDSPDTGTIAPGMAEKDIYSLWGAPIAVRRQGDMTFLYFRNGCEYSCGTEDVVFLKNGQVVDAVLRWPGHGYSGQSSSPASTPPHRPHITPQHPGGDSLTVKPSATS